MVAAAVLVAIVAFAAAGGGVKHVAATPTPAPAEPAERPLFGGSLMPRVRYRTRFFVPPLSFAVADTEWIAQGTTQPDRLLLVCTTIAPGAYLVRGTRMRRIVLMTPSPLVIDIIGATRRDLDSVEVPAMAVLRTLKTP